MVPNGQTCIFVQKPTGPSGFHDAQTEFYTPRVLVMSFGRSIRTHPCSKVIRILRTSDKRQPVRYPTRLLEILTVFPLKRFQNFL